MVPKKAWILLLLTALLTLLIFHSLNDSDRFARFSFYRLSFVKSESIEPDLNDFVLAVKQAVSMDKSTPGEDAFKFISVMPKYEPRSYRQPFKVDWYRHEDYRAPLGKAGKHKKDLEPFALALSRREDKLLTDLLRIVVYWLATYEIEFMLADGSLLGSLRHLDRIPWDEDIDINIPSKYRARLTEILQEQNEFDEISYLDKNDFVKVYNKSNTKAGDYHWTFPSVDIFFYTDNGTHLMRPYEGVSVIPREYVYPLKLRPFGEYWMPVPRNERGMLEKTRIRDFREKCVRGTWNHRLETPQKALVIDCESLKPVYPFTETIRIEVPNRASIELESIKLGDKRTVYLYYINDDIPVTISIEA